MWVGCWRTHPPGFYTGVTSDIGSNEETAYCRSDGASELSRPRGPDRAYECGAVALAAGQASVPAWLDAHAGEGEGQIAPVVLMRARELYQRKRSDGAVRNPCYFAMDATRPHDLGGNRLGRRFYVICEADGTFRAISAGHGGGRDLDGVADFSNGRRCVKNFGNAMDSDLTAGGAYVTGETAASFKGYYRASAGGEAVFMRAFLKFDGEGETANARERAIGGHAAVLLRGVCRRKDPESPHADQEGYVPFGKLVITRPGAATAAPAGRLRMLRPSSRW